MKGVGANDDPNFFVGLVFSPRIIPMNAPSSPPPGASALRPLGIVAPHGARIVEIRWPETVHKLPHELLRGYCPCAGCQGHSGKIKFSSGRNLELREIRPVGNYALGLVWGDSHDSGIFSFQYLLRLGVLLERFGSALYEEGRELPGLDEQSL